MLRIRNPELFPWKDIVQEYESSAYLSSSRFIEMMNLHAFSFCDSLENEQITNITVHGPAIQITKMPPITKESGPLSEDSKLFLKKSVPGEDIVWSLECHNCIIGHYRPVNGVDVYRFGRIKTLLTVLCKKVVILYL